jgi:DNA-binding PadR family transcriptional regulator
VSEVPRLTATECGILGLLSLGEASGYDLMKLADRSVGLIWRPVKSQLYASLPRFVELGLAEQYRVRQETRPDKVVYRLTDAGREALRTSLMELKTEGRSTYAIFNFKVFFGEVIGAEHVRETIKARRQFALKRLAELRRIQRGADADEDFYPLLTLELALEELRAYVRWANRTLARLDEISPAQKTEKRARKA